MASIGEVSATLKADIGQYVGPMQQAAQATQQIQQSVEQATTALLKEGAASRALDPSKIVSVGNAMAKLGTSTAGASQQAAALRDRLAALERLQLGKGASGFGRVAAAELEVVRRQLQAVTPLAEKASAATAKVAPAAQSAALSANHLRGSLANLASSAAGVPGPLGNIASRFLQFGVGGPVTVGVLAGLAAISLAWSKWRENVEKETQRAAEIWERTQARMRGRDAFIGLVEEREEAGKRLAAANATLASLERQRQFVLSQGGTIGAQSDFAKSLAAAQLEADAARRALESLGEAFQGVARDRRAAQDALQMAQTTGENARATLEYEQALRALADINAEIAASTNVTVEQLQAQASATDRVRVSTEAYRRLQAVAETTTRQEAAALQFAAAQMRALRDAGRDVFGDTSDLQAAQQVTRFTTQRREELQAIRDAIRVNLTLTEQETAALEAGTQAAMERVGLAENPAQVQKMMAGLKSDSTRLKDSIRQSGQDAEETMRSVAGTLSRAFVNAFSDNGKTITERITSVLGAALRAAVEKLIAQKIFEPLLNGLFGSGKSDSGSLLGNVVGGVIGGLLATPNAPVLAIPAMESSATIVVPLDNLPKPLGPVEMARDAMHMAVWVETARQAQANGVRLQPRFA